MAPKQRMRRYKEAIKRVSYRENSFYLPLGLLFENLDFISHFEYLSIIYIAYCILHLRFLSRRLVRKYVSIIARIITYYGSIARTTFK